MSENSITITPGPQQRASLRGMAAGTYASDTLHELPADAPLESLRAYFWLLVGTRLAQEVPDAEPELVEAFVHGARLSQPYERVPAFTLNVPSMDDASFGTSVVGEEMIHDPQSARQELARLLRVVADEVAETQVVDDGTKEGVLRSSEGRREVGAYTLDIFN